MKIATLQGVLIQSYMLCIIVKDCVALLHSYVLRVCRHAECPVSAFEQSCGKTLGHGVVPQQSEINAQIFLLCRMRNGTRGCRYCEFRLCVTAAGFGGRTKAVGLSPYPYEITKGNMK